MATSPTIVEPVQFPKVTVAGATLTVKLTFQSRYLLSKWKVNAQEIYRIIGATLNTIKEYEDAKKAAIDRGEDGESILVPEEDPEFTARAVELFAACVGHNYMDVGQPAPTVDYWVSKIASDQDPKTWQYCLRALFEAMGKASRDRIPATPETQTQPGAIQ